MAKLTVAVTPSSLFSFFSIRVAHDAQVIPLMASSTERLSAAMAVIGACSGLPSEFVVAGFVQGRRDRLGGQRRVAGDRDR